MARAARVARVAATAAAWMEEWGEWEAWEVGVAAAGEEVDMAVEVAVATVAAVGRPEPEVGSAAVVTAWVAVVRAAAALALVAAPGAAARKCSLGSQRRRAATLWPCHHNRPTPTRLTGSLCASPTL